MLIYRDFVCLPIDTDSVRTKIIWNNGIFQNTNLCGAVILYPSYTTETWGQHFCKNNVNESINLFQIILGCTIYLNVEKDWFN